MKVLGTVLSEVDISLLGTKIVFGGLSVGILALNSPQRKRGVVFQQKTYVIACEENVLLLNENPDNPILIHPPPFS